MSSPHDFFVFFDMLSKQKTEIKDIPPCFSTHSHFCCLYLQLMGKEKPIWRLAFFSRLEERKGIKLFVDAINQLDVSDIPNFEVMLHQKCNR